MRGDAFRMTVIFSWETEEEAEQCGTPTLSVETAQPTWLAVAAMRAYLAEFDAASAQVAAMSQANVASLGDLLTEVKDKPKVPGW